MAHEFKNSFYQIATEVVGLNPNRANAQRVLIDNLTTEATILKEIPFEKSTHALYNDFSRTVDAQGIDIVDFDGPLPEITASSQLDRVNLTPLGGQTIFGEDIANRFGGPDGYIESKLPGIIRKSGMKIEKSLYMRNFLGACARFNKLFSATETQTEDVQYTAMVAISWTPGEVCGLISPEVYDGPKVGSLFETKWLNGKNTFLHPNEKGENVISYGAYIKMMFGLQLENSDKISALVNILEVPTAEQLVAFVESAQVGTTTRIYCSRSTMTAIATKFSQENHRNALIAVNAEAQVQIMGVPFVTSQVIPAKMGKIDSAIYIK
jgi:hypothetical protein